MTRRKSNCNTPKCKGVAGLYHFCLECRKEGCPHTETHYNSNLAKVCDNCGETVKPAVKRKGRNMVGKGNKAPWQVNPLGLKMPATGGGDYA